MASKKTLRGLGRLLPQYRADRITLAVLVGLVVAVGIYLVTSSRAAGSGTLYLAPATASVASGATFTVTVRETSGTVPVNAVQVLLKYPAAQISFVGIDSSTGAFGIAAQQADNGSGTVTLARGSTTPLTGDQPIATITFKLNITKGSAALTFDPSSILVSSANSTNILSVTTGGTYSVKHSKK